MLKKIIIGLTVIFIMQACSYSPTRDLSYNSTNYISAPKNPEKILVVRQLIEDRSPRHYSSEMGHVWKTYIPLLPYITIPYERLDESDIMTRTKRHELTEEHKRFTSLFGEAIATDLENSGLFKEVRYIGDGDVPLDADYVLNGKLESTQFNTHMSSYMLGMPGVLLWTLPIPMQSHDATVKGTLLLENLSSQEISSYQLSGNANKWFTMYSSKAAISSTYSINISRYGKNNEGIDAESIWAYHASALRNAMQVVKSEMANSIK